MDFWRHSGFHLLDRDSAGRLVITDDFLRAYLLRPEIRPIDETGPLERALHDALMDEPRRTVNEAELELIEDADSRFNFGVWLVFRKRLLEAPSLESCYAGIFSSGRVGVPPLFLDQLAQIILRNILDHAADPLQARAAELFFREQKVTIVDGGAIMAADLETVERHASGSAFGSLGRLLVEAQTPTGTVNLDVLDVDNAADYWERDQRHEHVLSLNYGRAALAAFCRVLERWIAHFTGAVVEIESLRSIDDNRWAWHVGLDAEASSILNALWRGEALEAGDLRRLLCLFRLEFADPAEMRADIAGRPVYLALAMDDSNVIRMKPQNLLINLPLARPS